jgi:L-threonylcarbamoyladenylate synthase
METLIMPSSNPIAIETARNFISKGELIAFPTDTVYGLSSSPFNTASIEKIYIAKGRDFNKAVAILIGSLEQLKMVTTGFTEPAQRLAARFWPGALTLVAPIAPGLPGNISPYPTIGIRMPDHPFALALLQSLGPLATTSANRSGSPDARTAQEVENQLTGRVSFILDGGSCPGGVPSTVVDCCQPDIRILREGAILKTEIEKVLAG